MKPVRKAQLDLFSGTDLSQPQWRTDHSRIRVGPIVPLTTCGDATTAPATVVYIYLPNTVAGRP